MRNRKRQTWTLTLYLREYLKALAMVMRFVRIAVAIRRGVNPGGLWGRDPQIELCADVIVSAAARRSISVGGGGAGPGPKKKRGGGGGGGKKIFFLFSKKKKIFSQKNFFLNFFY